MFHDQTKIHDEMFRKMMDDMFPQLPNIPVPKSDKNYYEGRSGLQAIDIIEEYNMNFNLGNVIKYVLRAGLKSVSITLDDLRKAKYYLEREMNLLEERDE